LVTTPRHPFVRHLALLSLCLALLVPLYILLLNAFKTRADIVASPLSVPWSRLTTQNLTTALLSSDTSVLDSYRVSVTVTAFTVVGLIVFGGMMAYVIARQDKWVFRTFYFVIIAGMMVPPQAVLIPVVQILNHIGLLFSVVGLVLYEIASTLPITVFFYVGFIRHIPRELDYAAMIDGASPQAIYWRVIFPLLVPATAAIAVFLAIWTWNDFLTPLVILGPIGDHTITTNVYAAIGLQSVDYPKVYANLWLACIPILAIYVFAQRFIVSGLTEGALR